jgi:ferredoxin
VEAILPDTVSEADDWVDMNLKYSEMWPNITRKGEPPADADDFAEKTGKFDKYFSEKPGEA